MKMHFGLHFQRMRRGLVAVLCKQMPSALIIHKTAVEILFNKGAFRRQLLEVHSKEEE